MTNHWLRKRTTRLLLASGFLFQLGTCNFGSVTTSVTLDGRELIVSLFRAAILTPIDTLVTNAVNDFFGDEEN